MQLIAIQVSIIPTLDLDSSLVFAQSAYTLTEAMSTHKEAQSKSEEHSP